MAKLKKPAYGQGIELAARPVAAPDLPYRPQDPKRYRPAIALIGCGGVTQYHLRAYRKAGYNVVALCDVDPAKAEARRREFYPRAGVYSDYRDVLRREDVEVVDVATHPDVRVGQVEDALHAGKHVLSQKPFALDLARGRKLADLADRNGLKLAVNQNGRWAPHFSYIRHAVERGMIGDVLSAHLAVHWNHDWVAGTAFDRVRHLVLYDFAVHWFDLLTCFMAGKPARQVYASATSARGQKAVPPLLAQVLVEYDDAQASLAFDGFAAHGPLDTTYLAGTVGSIQSTGPNLGRQAVTLHTPRGVARPRLKGSWFPDGFHGAMGELLCAIEGGREPTNNARDNLTGLALCFAALRSADTGRPQTPGRVARVPGPPRRGARRTGGS